MKTEKSTTFKVRNEITQGTDKQKNVILSYCAVVM